MSQDAQLGTRRAIACSLDGSSMKGRVAEWAALGRKGLVHRGPHPSGVVLHYRRRDDIEAELKRLVALEGDCCRFLSFDLVEQEHDLILTVYGPEEAIPLIKECWGV